MLKFVALSRVQNRAAFDSGIPELNNFLKATARQHGEKGFSRTFVLIENDSPTDILGFLTLTLCEVTAASLPTAYAIKYPDHRLPAVRLARLAVSRQHQGKGYGALLLAEAVHRTVLISDQAGSIGLFVDAKNSNAKEFYRHFGFISLPDEKGTLFLPLKTLRAAINRD